MNEFKKIPAGKNSIANRKPIHGVGINDSEFLIEYRADGKRFASKAYSTWSGMFERCYSKRFHKKEPTYIECEICDEWKVFSCFESWFYSNYVEGYHLDKDLIEKGNKIYSPSTCLFIPRSVNNLITNREGNKGDHPVGVSFRASRGKFVAQLNIDGNNKHLGHFATAYLAHKCYVKAKNEEIKRKAVQFPFLSSYLLNHLIIPEK